MRTSALGLINLLHLCKKKEKRKKKENSESCWFDGIFWKKKRKKIIIQLLSNEKWCRLINLFHFELSVYEEKNAVFGLIRGKCKG